jgi:type I restriction enzyme M protein
LTYRVEILPSAQRELAALSPREQKRINERIRRLADTPRPLGITVLQGQKVTYYRLPAVITASFIRSKIRRCSSWWSRLATAVKSPTSLDYDAFGRIYEYFLGEFARTEGQKGGEFYTPSSIVRLIVEILEPSHGRILDPACGSGGMFVQSARFVAEHRQNPSAELSIHGQEKVAATVALCRMNLAMHGLEGDIREAITYYEDLHQSTGRFDFVVANPPFNVNAVDKEHLANEVGSSRRFPFGLPRTDNANYLWIQLFTSALNGRGRAGFVMANSASDTRASEQELRRQLIEVRAVDVMVAVGPNTFYTVTLPCILGFLDKGKKNTARADTVLFVDARHIYRQIDRAHRDWTDARISFLANLVRLYRDEEPDFTLGGDEAKLKLYEIFSPSSSTGEGRDEGEKRLAYRDIPGLCKAATLKDIEAQAGRSIPDVTLAWLPVKPTATKTSKKSSRH